VLAKWPATDPRILLLDEPTRGIDINAKKEIYALINEFTRAGLAVIMVTSKLSEVLAIADRTVLGASFGVIGTGRRTPATFERRPSHHTARTIEGGVTMLGRPFLVPILVGLAAALAGASLGTAAEGKPEIKQRIFVLTDISNEPDDEESLVRFLVYSNEFDVEGLVATTSTWLRNRTREDIIRRFIGAYGEVRPNLLKHAPGYPTTEQLLAVTGTGQPRYGMTAVGMDKSSAGSKLLIQAIDRNDERPLWVTVWGGPNTLAQALSDMRATRSAEELKRALAKVRVYTISDQDDSGPWIRKEFPDLFYIVSPSSPMGNQGYARSTWTGISGDRFYKNGPMVHFDLVSNPWLEEHIIKNHGPLGALYPKVRFIMEGDTPSYLGLINNGLGWHVSPAYGGWGGRYVLDQPQGEPRSIWTNNNKESRDTVTIPGGKTETSDFATIWRWRQHYQHDFAARMNWCVADEYKKANHNPIAVLNSDRSKNVLSLTARGGSTVKLSAKGTSDPDGNSVKVTWWVYTEAGALKTGVTLTKSEGLTTEIILPNVSRQGSLHVVLQVEDDGMPKLWSYRRAVIEVSP
jgi:hypothetical protein